MEHLVHRLVLGTCHQRSFSRSLLMSMCLPRTGPGTASVNHEVLCTSEESCPPDLGPLLVALQSHSPAENLPHCTSVLCQRLPPGGWWPVGHRTLLQQCRVWLGDFLPVHLLFHRADGGREVKRAGTWGQKGPSLVPSPSPFSVCHGAGNFMSLLNEPGNMATRVVSWRLAQCQLSGRGRP